MEFHTGTPCTLSAPLNHCHQGQREAQRGCVVCPRAHSQEEARVKGQAQGYGSSLGF